MPLLSGMGSAEPFFHFTKTQITESSDGNDAGAGQVQNNQPIGPSQITPTLYRHQSTHNSTI